LRSLNHGEPANANNGGNKSNNGADVAQELGALLNPDETHDQRKRDDQKSHVGVLLEQSKKGRHGKQHCCIEIKGKRALLYSGAFRKRNVRWWKQKNNDGFYFNKQYKHIGCIRKRARAGHGEDGAQK
jgi:hypothetical protein